MAKKRTIKHASVAEAGNYRVLDCNGNAMCNGVIDMSQEIPACDGGGIVEYHTSQWKKICDVPYPALEKPSGRVHSKSNKEPEKEEAKVEVEKDEIVKPPLLKKRGGPKSESDKLY